VGRDCHCQDGVQVLFDVGMEKMRMFLSCSYSHRLGTPDCNNGFLNSISKMLYLHSMALKGRKAFVLIAQSGSQCERPDSGNNTSA
jgi:hypothetical protein